MLVMTSAGLFGWAVRGSSGYGAVPGCVFAGTLWGALWYLLAREPAEEKRRRYSSGWSVLAVTAGVGVSGMQGWSQWGNWVQGRFYVDWASGQFLPVNPAWGYAWWFVVAVHWGGMGSVFLAWTGSKVPPNARDWALRLAMGAAGAAVAWLAFEERPDLFLPHYDALDGYDPAGCVQCVRAYNDCRQALAWLGAYAGFVAHEALRRDWTNVKLILTVGLVTGIGWVAFQFWQFADDWFPGVAFNWWRCWESSAGGVVGLAYGVAFARFNRPAPPGAPPPREQPFSRARNAEKLLGVHGALAVGLTWSFVAGVKGWMNVYLGIDETLWGWAAPAATLAVAAWGASCWANSRDPLAVGDGRDATPHYPALFAVAYALNRELGLQVTGPLNNWVEAAFFAYYLALAAFDVAVLLAWRGKKLKNERRPSSPAIDRDS
ncbi:MAG: hypothetical protein Kow0069_29150 [Promethearchaeota archaeon]